MAHNVEPMDIDDIVSDFDNKENTFQHSNVLVRTPSTEKGYEELDVSELNMKLRYSITPASSPMSKSYSVNCADSRNFDSGDDPLNNIVINGNGSLTRSLNITKTEPSKVGKVLPLQTLPTDQLMSTGRSSSILRSLDSSVNDKNDVTVTVTDANEIDENISYPSSSSSIDHTPEPITPTTDIPKHDGGSPIMRGLKTVLNMFRSSQSPIPTDNENLSPADVALPDYEDEEEAPPKAVASTPLATEKHKKCNSPLKESQVFNEDLEKELHWNEDSTIFFPDEKIPIHKLFFQQGRNNKQNEIEKLDVTVEYMDVSYNDSVREKTMTEDQANRTAVDSDGEFVDCETTFSKNDTADIISHTMNKDISNVSCEQNPDLEASILNATVPSNQTSVIVSGVTSTEENNEVCSFVPANVENNATPKQDMGELQHELCLNVTNTELGNVNSNTATEVCKAGNNTFDEVCSPVKANVTILNEDKNTSKQEIVSSKDELLSLISVNETSNVTTGEISTEVSKTVVYEICSPQVVNYAEECNASKQKNATSTAEQLCISFDVNIEKAIPSSYEKIQETQNAIPSSNEKIQETENALMSSNEKIQETENAIPSSHDKIQETENILSSNEKIQEPANAIPSSHEKTQEIENACALSSVFTFTSADLPESEIRLETSPQNSSKSCFENELKKDLSTEETLSNEKKPELNDANIQMIPKHELIETSKDKSTNIEGELDLIHVNLSHCILKEKSSITMECEGNNFSVSDDTINTNDPLAKESFIPQLKIINSEDHSITNAMASETIVSLETNLATSPIKCIQNQITGVDAFIINNEISDQKCVISSTIDAGSADELPERELSDLQETDVVEQAVLPNNDKSPELKDEINNELKDDIEKSNETNAGEKYSCDSSVQETPYEIRLSENMVPLSPVIASRHTETKTTDSTGSDTKMKLSPPLSPKIVSKGYNFNFDEIDDPFATKTKIRQSPPPDGLNRTVSENKSLVEFPKRDMKNQRRESQPLRNKPSKVNSKFNATFDSSCEISTIKKVHVMEPSPSQHIAEEKLKVQNTELTSETTSANAENKFPADSVPININTDADVIDVELPAKQFFDDKSVDQNVDEIKILSSNSDKASTQEDEKKPIESIPTTIETEFSRFSSVEINKQPSLDTSIALFKGVEPILEDKLQVGTSSSEQSVYISAATSSTECIEQKNTFNLPEIDSSIEFNPFASKSKMRSSPDIHLGDTEYAIDIESKNNVEECYVEEVPADTSYMTCSSKATDEKDATIQEIHTDNDDTVEGPFLEAGEFDDKINDFKEDEDDMMKFSNVPTQAIDDNADAGEMFIDAEAFEFLLNQNQCSAVCDSGKESLFLKFDPLFAKRISSSEGVAEALHKFRQRQRTPKKASPLSNHVEDSCAGPSKINITYEGDAHNIFDESNDELNITVSKPMMVVNPAVNPVATPRNKVAVDTTRVVSPAVAVIDRLLSMSANNSFVGHDNTVSNIGRGNHETELALMQLRSMLDDKKNSNKTYRDECEKLKDRLSVVETQLKGLEEEHKAKSKKCSELEEKLTEVTEMNKGMASVVEKYERTIATLIAETEQEKKLHAEERIQLIKERDEQAAHLTSMEISFNDLHSKYEKSKQIILTYKSNEEICLKSIAEYEENYDKIQKNYESLKQHATSKLNHANEELEKINRAHQSEVLKLNAMIKRRDVNISSLEETLAQKTKANEELTAICDELINKVG